MKHFAIVPSLLLTVACVSGPSYQVPKEAIVRQPAARAGFLSAAGPTFTQAEPPDRWWELYDDAGLSGLVAEALAANKDLAVADANLRRAQAAIDEARAARTISTTVSSSAALSRPAATNLRLPGDVGYDAGVSVAYPLDLAGKLKRAIEAAGADAEAVQAARDGVRVAVAAGVTRAYAEVCSANHTLTAYARIVSIQRQSYDLTSRLQRGGRGTAFDVSRAQTAVQQSQAELPTIVASRQAALFQLAALLGRPPAAFPQNVAGCATAPTLSQPIPVGDGAMLLMRRPDLRAAERSLAAATARIGVATADLYPSVTLGGTMGFTEPTFGASLATGFSMSFGPLLSWNFPNRRLARTRIAEAGASAEAAAAQYDAVAIEALRQTETALSAYAQELDRNLSLRLARDSAQTASAQAQRLFRYGRTDFLPVLTAQGTLATSEAALAQSDATLAERQVDLFQALGGGWKRLGPAS